MEIIVIDDGSTDGTAAYIKTHFPDVKIIRNERPLGPAFAKNQGIVKSQGKYICFLDSDSEFLKKETVSTMVAIMESDEQIGMLGGDAEMDAQGNIEKVYGNRITWDGRSYTVPSRKLANQGQRCLFPCDYLPTSSCFVRTSLVLRIGGFDPYYRYMGEDKEQGMLIKNLRYKALFGIAIGILHKFDETVRKDRHFMYLKCKGRFVLKNKGLWLFLFLPIIDLFYYFLYCPIIFLICKLLQGLRSEGAFRQKNNPLQKLPDIKWLLLAPYYFVKAYWLNLLEMQHTLQCRGKNFLSPDIMEQFARLEND